MWIDGGKGEVDKQEWKVRGVSIETVEMWKEKRMSKKEGR